MRHKPPKPKEVKPRHKKPGPDSPYEIMFETRKLVRLLGQQSVSLTIGRQLDRLIQQGDSIMSALTDLQNKMADVATAISEEKKEVQGMLTDLKTQIKALQDQIAAGGTVGDADLIALSAKADEIIGQVKGISEPVA
jgi:hypothetical protein